MAFRFVVAMGFLVVGSAVLAWVGVTTFWTARGFDWAMWAAPFLSAEDPVYFGNRMINQTGVISVFGILASAIGLVLLTSVRSRSHA